MTGFLAGVALIAAALPQQQLTIEQAVGIAVENAFAVRIAESQFEQAKANHAAAGGALGPKISGSAQYVRLAEGVSTGSGSGGFGGSTADSKQVSLVLSQLIDIFGVTRNSVQAARFQRMSSEMLVEAQVNEIKSLVRAQFYQTLQAKALVLVQSDELTSARQRLANAKLREAAGDVSRFDVMRLETDAKRSEQALLEAEGAYTLAKQALNSLLGRAIETVFEPADVAPQMDVRVSADDAVAAAHQNRPEVKSNNFLVQAADKLVGVEAGGLKPSLSFSAQYSRVIDPAPGQFENSLFGVLNLSIPLYDSGITRNRTAAARAVREQAQIRLEQVRLSVSSDVHSAITRLETTRRGYEVAQAGLEFARESLRLAQLRYDEGAGILLDVTTAQGELTRARAALVTAQYQYLSAVAALQRALGTDDLNPQVDPR